MEFRHLSTWLGHEDFLQMIMQAITVPRDRLPDGLGRLGQYAELLG